MGFIGKLFVMLQAVFSIACLLWAVAVYTQRLDWSKPAKGDDPGGIIEKSQGRIKVLNGANDVALYRWSSNLSSVVALEGERFPRREFFYGQLNLLEIGALAPGEPAVVPSVQVLNTDADTGFLLITQPMGRKPIEVRPGVNAKSIKEYLAEIQQTEVAITDLQKDIAKLIADQTKVTEEIVGVPPMRKGLRKLISEQQLIDENARLESTYLDDFLTNRNAEFGLYLKRLRALEDRRDELRKLVPDNKPQNGN